MSSSRRRGRRRRIIIDTDSSSDEDDSSNDDWMFLNQGLFQGKENENKNKNEDGFVQKTRHELLDIRSDTDSVDVDETLTNKMRVITIHRKMSDSSEEAIIVQSSQTVQPKTCPTTKSTNIQPSEIITTNDAWCHDQDSDEYYLSSKNHHIPGVTWPALRLPAELFNRLFPHQKIGVQWIASLHSKKIGGLLGDDMGLGKVRNNTDNSLYIGWMTL